MIKMMAVLSSLKELEAWCLKHYNTSKLDSGKYSLSPPSSLASSLPPLLSLLSLSLSPSPFLRRKEMIFLSLLLQVIYPYFYIPNLLFIKLKTKFKLDYLLSKSRHLALGGDKSHLLLFLKNKMNFISLFLNFLCHNPINSCNLN